MDKRIGKFNFLLALALFGFITIDAQQELQLRVINKNNDKPITKLAIGVPYRLEIQAEGIQDLYKIIIPGLENFHSDFCSASRNNINSHLTTVHEYVLRADKVGSFTLGPVQLVNAQGITLRSNTLVLDVEYQEQADVIVEMIFDKTSIIAGQKVLGKIRFCTCTQLQLINLQPPTLEAEYGTFSDLGQPQQSSATINGKKYECYEFPIDLMLKKPGQYTMPKIGAYCRVPIRSNRSSGLFSVQMHNFEDRWYYATESVVMQVNALPPCSSPVDGIGCFDSFVAHIDHAKARMGEGMVLTLILEGKEGIQDCKQPALKIPEGLKYYESKSNVEALSGGRHKKTFEYIVQGIQEGLWQIPAQLFTFFNTEINSYVTLKTKPLSITIGAGIPSYVPVNNLIDDVINDLAFTDQEIYTINDDGPWHFTAERLMGILWFLIALIIPCIVLCFMLIKNYINGLQPEYWLQKRKKYAFKQTRKKLITIKKNNNFVQLYETFIQFFVDRCEIPLTEMNADRIEQILKNAGFVTETIDQWNRFFHQIAEYAFFKQVHDQTMSHDLLNRAQIWVNQLEEKL